MKKEEIEEKIEKHQLWLKNKPGGERADFSNANLSGLDLPQINLSYARFSYTNLTDANLSGSKLNCVDFTGAQLLHANLYDASLTNARLNNAKLTNARLTNVNMSGADLTGTELSNININYLTRGIHPAPEGSLIGWGKKAGKLVKLLIPAEARRSCATTRKHRAEFAQVLWIEDGLERVVVENSYGKTVYKVGQTVHCFWWGENRWKECSGGIHFFLSREEAMTWN